MPMRLAFQGRNFAERTSAESPLEPARLPMSRSRRSRRLLRRLWMAALAASSLSGALALLNAAQNPVSPGAGAPATPPAPSPAWIEIPRPVELFRLEAPELGKETRSYEARRRRTGSGRQDILAFGGVNGSGPFLRLTLYQLGAERAPDAAFYVDLARRAAEIGRAITRAAQPTALPTRFGGFEAADLTLMRSDSSQTACLGFRSANGTGKLRITGFACNGADGSLPLATSKPALACLLDRIELAPAAENAEVIALFAARELNGDTACAERAPEPTPLRGGRFDEAQFDAAQGAALGKSARKIR